MQTSDNAPSHARDLVAQIVQDNPEMAEALVRLFVLADASTPKGAAIRSEALMYAYSFTDHCRTAMEKFIAA